MAAANILWLKLVLILLWICGYFPVRNPVKPKLRIDKLSISFIISVALVVVTKIAQVNFLLGVIITQGGVKTKVSSASLILYGCSQLGLILNDLAARLVGILYGSKICLLIQNLNTFDCFKRSWGSVNAKPLGKVNTNINEKSLGHFGYFISGRSNPCFDSDSSPQLKWKDLKYYFFWALISLMHGWIVTLYTIWNFEEPEITEVFFNKLPSKWLTDASRILLNALSYTSCVVPPGFLIIMGSALIDNYRRFCQILGNQYNPDVGIICKKLVNSESGSKIPVGGLTNKIEPQFEDDFVDSFTKLRESFYWYNDVAGVYAISNLFLLAMNLSYAIYYLIWPQQGQGTAPIILFSSTVLHMSLLLTFSNYIKNQLVYTSEWVVSWNWDFSGCNICRINYELIPAIVCSLVAFMTFLIQLEMSEKSNTGCTQTQSTNSKSGNF